MRKTKIIATIGPSTDSEEMIEKLIVSGVNVFRFNFSHGTHEYHQKNLIKIRKISKELKKHIGILADISGPKIRLGLIDGEIILNYGDILEIHKQDMVGKYNKVSLSQPQIIDDLKIGDLVYIADGTIRLEVVEVFSDKVCAKTVVGGKISSKKGLNFPGTRMSINPITKKDEDDIKFGCSIGVDFFALSFVTSKQNILDAKELISSLLSDIPVFAKIERFEALECIDDILDVSDGIMVARGDLGVELGVELVPNYQKMLIKKANEYSKPVITATQMLSSMINSQYPTRAEVSDVANAVLDGTDCVMLSDETTIGKYPIEAINILNKVLIETEKIYPYYKDLATDQNLEHAVLASADMLARNIKANAMIVYTKTGASAIIASKFRPQSKIFANSYNEDVLRRLSLVWGVEPGYAINTTDAQQEHSDFIIYEFLKKAFAEKKVYDGWTYVVTFGKPLGKSLRSNTIRIIDSYAIEHLESTMGNSIKA
jgi:pyruvate kinase